MLVVIAAVGAAAGALLGEDVQHYFGGAAVPTEAAALAARADTWNFLAIGDWGNDSPGQKAAAKGMGVVAADINATKVFCLGDNFYGSGIHTPQDGPDGEFRFKKTFEVGARARALPFSLSLLRARSLSAWRFTGYVTCIEMIPVFEEKQQQNNK